MSDEKTSRPETYRWTEELLNQVLGHTDGPWVAGRSDMGTIVDGVESKWIYAGEKYIAVASGRDVEEWDEVMANARLIAAAPTLLAENIELKRQLTILQVARSSDLTATKAGRDIERDLQAKEVAELRKDKARLDWLEKQCGGKYIWQNVAYPDIRSASDAAMEKKSE